MSIIKVSNFVSMRLKLGEKTVGALFIDSFCFCLSIIRYGL